MCPGSPAVPNDGSGEADRGSQAGRFAGGLASRFAGGLAGRFAGGLASRCG